jgi:hypothetical protein
MSHVEGRMCHLLVHRKSAADGVRRPVRGCALQGTCFRQRRWCSGRRPPSCLTLGHHSEHPAAAVVYPTALVPELGRYYLRRGRPTHNARACGSHRHNAVLLARQVRNEAGRHHEGTSPHEDVHDVFLEHVEPMCTAPLTSNFSSDVGRPGHGACHATGRVASSVGRQAEPLVC